MCYTIEKLFNIIFRPDTQTYIEKLKKEDVEKSKGQQGDNRSFFAKYVSSDKNRRIYMYTTKIKGAVVVVSIRFTTTFEIRGYHLLSYEFEFHSSPKNKLFLSPLKFLNQIRIHSEVYLIQILYDKVYEELSMTVGGLLSPPITLT